MACAVPANTAAWIGVTPGLAKIGMQSKSPMAKRRHGLQHPIWRLDRSGKGEFRRTVGIEDAPIGADTAFKGLPRLVERLDDRVVDAHGVGAGDEIADDIAPAPPDRAPRQGG